MTGEDIGVPMLEPGGYGTIAGVRPGVARRPALQEEIKLDHRVDAEWPPRLPPTWRMRQVNRIRHGK